MIELIDEKKELTRKENKLDKELTEEIKKLIKAKDLKTITTRQNNINKLIKSINKLKT